MVGLKKKIEPYTYIHTHTLPLTLNGWLENKWKNLFYFTPQSFISSVNAKQGNLVSVSLHAKIL